MNLYSGFLRLSSTCWSQLQNYLTCSQTFLCEITDFATSDLISQIKQLFLDFTPWIEFIEIAYGRENEASDDKKGRAPQELSDAYDKYKHIGIGGVPIQM